MSGSINQILYNASSGMSAQKALMQLAGKNVANADSPSYSRQRMQLFANAAPGMAVAQGALEAIRSSTLQRSILGAAQGLGFQLGRQEVLKLAEPAIDDLQGSGVSKALGDFFESVSELGGNPTGMAERQQILAKARALAQSIRASASTLEDARVAAEKEGQLSVASMNEITSEIARLNKEISARRNTDDPGPELVDQRDVLLGQLAGNVDIQTLEQSDGTVSVFLASGPVLVDGDAASTLELQGGGQDPLSLSVRRPDGSTLSPMAPPGGRLGGTFEARDKVLASALSKLDDLASGLAGKMNALHAAGFGLDGSTGIPLFEPPAAVQGAALNFSLSAAIDGHPEKVAAANDATLLPGDDSNIAAMLALQDDATAVGGTKSFASAWDGVVETVTFALHDASSQAAVQQGRVEHFEASRASLSGVSIQEEMAQLSQAQRAFEASTKVVEVADQLYEAVLRMV